MTSAVLAPPTPPREDTAGGSVAVRAFLSILGRDIYVVTRELPSFFAQTLLQPFFIVFIFGKVLAEMGLTGENFSQILLPGVVALNAFIGALQSTAMPLVIDFSYSREIEDRLLAPLSVRLVALEKIVFGGLRGFVAGVLMVPIGFLVLDGVVWQVPDLLPAAGIMLLGSLAAAALGMAMGTLVPPKRIEITFVVTLTPLMFTGATQFPWSGLSELRWFQVVCACNPLTYVSEGMRAVLISGTVTSIPIWISFFALVFSCVFFGIIGTIGFVRRALD